MATQGSTETVKHPSLVEDQKTQRRIQAGKAKSTLEGGLDNQAEMERSRSSAQVTETCFYCGAWKGALGQEDNPDLFAEHLCQVFDAYWDPLRDDGSVMTNLGDSYAGGGNTRGKDSPISAMQASNAGATGQTGMRLSGSGLKQKDLCLVPQRFVLAMQRRGWYVRSEIIWAKPNPMVGSAKDRPASSHEVIWMFSKQPHYYYDSFSAKVPTTTKGSRGKLRSQMRRGIPFGGDKLSGGDNPTYSGNLYDPSKHSERNIHDVWYIPPQSSNWDYCTDCCTLFVGKQRKKIDVWWTGLWDFEEDDFFYDDDGDVRVIKVRFCPCGSETGWAGHFAMWPPTLTEFLINITTPEHGSCAGCGTPYQRLTRKTYDKDVKRRQDHQGDWKEKGQSRKPGNINSGDFPTGKHEITVGWAQNCDCETDRVTPAIVCDPFGGAFTTAMAAERLGRAWVSCDISETYCEIGLARILRVRGEERAGKILGNRQYSLFEFRQQEEE
jgi:hypothetical protein